MRHAFIPNLIHEVLFFELVEELLLGSSIGEVEARLECIMPWVVSWEFFLIAILSCLSKLLQQCGISSCEVILLLREFWVVEVIFLILSMNWVNNPWSSGLDLLHDALTKLSLTSISDVIEAIKVDQLCFAEDRRLGAIDSDVVLFFLHLFKLWHLN